MVSFVNFARIAVICEVFILVHCMATFFHEDFWPNLNFPLEYQIKLVLMIVNFKKFNAVSQLTGGQ